MCIVITLPLVPPGIQSRYFHNPCFKWLGLVVFHPTYIPVVGFTGSGGVLAFMVNGINSVSIVLVTASYLPCHMDAYVVESPLVDSQNIRHSSTANRSKFSWLVKSVPRSRAEVLAPC